MFPFLPKTQTLHRLRGRKNVFLLADRVRGTGWSAFPPPANQSEDSPGILQKDKRWQRSRAPGGPTAAKWSRISDKWSKVQHKYVRSVFNASNEEDLNSKYEQKRAVGLDGKNTFLSFFIHLIVSNVCVWFGESFQFIVFLSLIRFFFCNDFLSLTKTNKARKKTSPVY